MKITKKLAGFALACTMAFGLFAGCNSPASSASSQAQPSTVEAEPQATLDDQPPAQEHKIAVLVAAMGAAELQMKDYLENYVGPAFNVQFMFSEIIKDNGAAVTFIEQARAAGCEGVLNFNSDTLEQSTSTANEAGMYILTQTNRIPESIQDMPFNLGSMGSSAATTAEAYGKLVEDLVADGEPHNVVIVSGGSAQGNLQHKETTITILNILKETYDLTYDQSVEDLAVSSVQTEINTGTDVKIAIYPGFAGTDTYVTGFSSLLQSGDYDAVLCTYAIFGQLMQPISEVEQALGMDVKLISIANIADGTQSAFEQDALDSAVLGPSCMTIGGMFIVMYNALEGNAAAIQKDGKPSQYDLLKWSCADKDAYATMEKLDIEPATYAVTIESINSLLVSKNPDVDYEAINAFMNSLTAETVAKNAGL